MTKIPGRDLQRSAAPEKRMQVKEPVIYEERPVYFTQYKTHHMHDRYLLSDGSCGCNIR